MVQVLAPLRSRLNRRQFQPVVGESSFTGGPQEATTRHLEHRDPDALRRRPSREELSAGRQGQLFKPESLPMAEAHQQTPEQFGKDPRTWWHGRVMHPQAELPAKPPGSHGEGFHAGTETAARERVTHNIESIGLRGGMVGRMYPLRLTGPVSGPEEARSDVSQHKALGSARSGYLYKNAAEDPGKLSVGTPTRKGFLSTHREMVTAAERRGENVHPSISWAAQHATEHTGEAMRESWQGDWKGPGEPHQMSLLSRQWPS